MPVRGGAQLDVQLSGASIGRDSDHPMSTRGRLAYGLGNVAKGGSERSEAVVVDNDNRDRKMSLFLHQAFVGRHQGSESVLMRFLDQLAVPQGTPRAENCTLHGAPRRERPGVRLSSGAKSPHRAGPSCPRCLLWEERRTSVAEVDAGRTQNGLGGPPIDAEVLDELIEGYAVRKPVEELLHREPATPEARRAAHAIRIYPHRLFESHVVLAIAARLKACFHHRRIRSIGVFPWPG